MKKAPEAFRTISEVADLLDTPAHVLRFWESKFYQIRPVKRAGGRRYYRPDDVALINGIRALLQDRGMTIRGAQRILQEEGVKAVAQLGLPLPDGGAMLRVVRAPVVAEDDAEEDLRDVTGPADEAPQDWASEAGHLPAPVEGALPEPTNPVASDPQKTVETQPVPEYALIQAMVEHRPEVVPEPAPAATGAVRGDGMSDEDLLAPLADLPDPALSPVDRRQPVLPPVPEIPENAAEIPQRAQIARALRQMPRATASLHRDRLGLLARRIDSLLERMSEASGAGRW